MAFFSNLLDLLFPPRCVFCRKLLKKGEKDLCTPCRTSLPYTDERSVRQKGEFYEFCLAPLFYKDQVRESLLRFKFKGKTHYAACYGALLSDCIRQNMPEQYDLISWVPLSDRRRRSRGYDQAALLGMAAALELDTVAVETLKKLRDNPAQSSLSGGADSRRANVSGIYAVSDPELISGKTILLIDDIVTTGATLSECARTLRTAGAARVFCAAVARSELD